MDFLCIGLSHKSAPVEVREALAVSPERQRNLLVDWASGAEAMMVSTCNRVEVYAVGDDLSALAARLRGTLRSLAGASVEPYLFERRSQDAMLHLFRVAASLDSMVVGEAQILGQVKEAFELGVEAGAVRTELHRACHAAFKTAKRVRTETAVGRAATSMASAAVELGRKVFGELQGRTVLVVGAGEMAELSARHLLAAGAHRLIVVNRTYDRARALADWLAAEARPWEELWTLLAEVDVVATSTASPTPLFTSERMAPIVKARRYRPLFMVDLAVPRDIASNVNELDEVYAYDVDDIQKVLAENGAARAEEAARAEQIIVEEVALFWKSRAVREATPVVRRLRERAMDVAQAEAERTLAALGPALTDKHKKSIEAMANAIVNKLLHAPTQLLRAAAEDPPENARLSAAAAELFGLEHPDTEKVEDSETDPDTAALAGRLAGGQG